MRCAICNDELVEEDIFLKRTKYIHLVYNLHCLRCDTYFSSNWKESGFINMAATHLSGRSLRKAYETMSEKRAKQQRIDSEYHGAPYCVIWPKNLIKIPRDFHEQWLRYKKSRDETLIT
jgi:uncharacterized C2H2 Zn-finger protein